MEEREPERRERRDRDPDLDRDLVVRGRRWCAALDRLPLLDPDLDLDLDLDFPPLPMVVLPNRCYTMGIGNMCPGNSRLSGSINTVVSL